jgi:hypothetical protein
VKELWARAKSPRVILLAALAVFLIYSWPGFIGWDTRDHMVQARLPTFSDGHPPFVILLVRICDFFVRGPALVLLVQGVSLLVGLYSIFTFRLERVPAAIATACVFLWPPIAGITALIAKDGMMAGFLMIGIGCLLRDDKRWWGVVFVLAGGLMRWNSLPATFAPILLLFKLTPTIRGVRRYAVAFAIWLAVSIVAYEANALLADRAEYTWYWSAAYEDIAGTIEHAHLEDAELDRDLEGTPLRFHDHLNERFHAVYNPANFYQLMRDGDTRPWDSPTTEEQRAAVARAWKTIVTGHPGAYIAYRIENFRLLNQIDHPETFTNVYVWFTVFAAPETIAELQHDANASRIQRQLIDAHVWFSLTPMYWVFWYFALCFAMLPLCVRRRPLELALLLSAIGYQLSWFFLAQSTDYRYSSWMELCAVIVSVLLIASFIRARRSRAARRTDSAAAVPAA